MYKSNWLVVSAWSNTTKVAGSNPDGFCKKMFRFFFCFWYEGPTFDSPGVHKNIFSLQSATANIYTVRVTLSLSKNAGWLRCINTTTNTWYESYGKNGTRYDRHDEGEVHENREREGGVREPQRLGMSQGTMNREPKCLSEPLLET